MGISYDGYDIVINPPQEIPCKFATYLFNQADFLRQQLCRESHTFYLIKKASGQAYARFNLFIQANKGISPCRGTFGSVEADSNLPAEALDFFVRSIDTFAETQKLTQLYIKAYPFCYAPQLSANITASFLRNGFLLAHTELNYHIPVTVKPFAQLLHLSEKRRLRRCISKGFLVEEAKELPFKDVYEMIVQTRLRRNFPVTLNYAEFRELFVSFPQDYRLLTVRDNNQIIAAAVAVRINADIVYYFLPADDFAYRSYSPMVLLIKGLYDYCQREGFQLLDLGISTDKGTPNYGLMRFKQNLGAQTSLKLSFIKNYS